VTLAGLVSQAERSLISLGLESTTSYPSRLQDLMLRPLDLMIKPIDSICVMCDTLSQCMELHQS
jgi:hypothetical protein